MGFDSGFAHHCCMQGSASECVLVSMLAARHAALEDLKLQYPGVEDGVLLARMVAYCSKLVRAFAALLTSALYSFGGHFWVGNFVFGIFTILF